MIRIIENEQKRFCDIHSKIKKVEKEIINSEDIGIIIVTQKGTFDMCNECFTEFKEELFNSPQFLVTIKPMFLTMKHIAKIDIEKIL